MGKWPEIKYTEKIVPDAYHGTSLQNAKSIASKGFKEYEVGSDLYLGDGIYFYESSRRHAELWAKQRLGEGSLIGVLLCSVNLGRCLDLNKMDHRAFLIRQKRKIEEKAQPARRVTDPLVINLLAKVVRFDTVRASLTTPGKGPVFEGSRIWDYQSLIICVRNMDNILSTSICYEGGAK